MDKISMVCIVCPLGCKLEIYPNPIKENSYNVEGSKCKRGETYAIKEITNPTRMLTSTVKIKNSHLSRIPVKTEEPIPKSKIFDCMNELNSVEVEAPVKMGDIIVKNILNTGINIIATRSMDVD